MLKREILDSAFAPIKTLEGKSVKLSILEDLADGLCRAAVDSGYMEKSEGWSYTDCPEDYEPCDVIFGDDTSLGLDNPNDEGNNLFEIQFTEEGAADRNPDHTVVVEFAQILI